MRLAKQNHNSKNQIDHGNGGGDQQGVPARPDRLITHKRPLEVMQAVWAAAVGVVVAFRPFFLVHKFFSGHASSLRLAGALRNSLIVLGLFAGTALGQAGLPWTADFETGNLSQLACYSTADTDCRTNNASLNYTAARAHAGTGALFSDAVTGTPGESLLDSIGTVAKIRFVYWFQEDTQPSATVTNRLAWRNAANTDLFGMGVATADWKITAACDSDAVLGTLADPALDTWQQVEFTWERGTAEACVIFNGGAPSCVTVAGTCDDSGGVIIENFHYVVDGPVDLYFDDFLAEEVVAVTGGQKARRPVVFQ